MFDVKKNVFTDLKDGQNFFLLTSFVSWFEIDLWDFQLDKGIFIWKF